MVNGNETVNCAPRTLARGGEYMERQCECGCKKVSLHKDGTVVCKQCKSVIGKLSVNAITTMTADKPEKSPTQEIHDEFIDMTIYLIKCVRGGCNHSPELIREIRENAQALRII